MPRQLTPQDLVGILRRWWPLPVILAIFGAGAGYGVAHFLPKRFTSETLVLVQQPTVPGDYVKPVVTQDTNTRLASMQQEILSRSRLEPIIGQFGLYSADINKKVPMEDLVDRLRKAITVTPIEPIAQTASKTLPGFTISVNFDDAHLAQQICTNITSMFIEESIRLRQQQSEQTTDFVSKQLDDSKAKLDEQEAKLADFKRHNLGSLPSDEQANLNLMTVLSSQLDTATEALSRAQQEKSFDESMLQQQLAAWQGTPSGQSPETQDKEVATLQAQLDDLRTKDSDDHPDVKKAKNALEALQRKIAAEADDKNKAADADKPGKPLVEPAQIQSLRAQIRQYDQEIHDRTAQQEATQQQIKIYQARLQSSPAVEQEYSELSRGYQTALDGYNNLLKLRDQSAMATDLEKRQEGEQFTIQDPANLPDAPSFPKKSLFVIGGFGGGMALGLGLALVVEMQNTSLRNEKDVESLLQLPVLALVPSIQPLSGKKAKGASLNLALRA